MLSRNALGDLSGTAQEAIGLGTAGLKLGSATGLIGTIPGLTSSAGVAAGGASLGSLAIPIAGVAIAALPFAINLAKCGTITTIGCTKISDSKLTIDAFAACCQIAYAWEQGQITTSEAQSYLQQLSQEVQGAMQRPTDFTGPTTFYTCCGTIDNNGTSMNGAPCTSPGTKLIPTGTKVSVQQAIQEYMAYVSGPQPVPAGIGAGVVSGSPTIGAIAGGVEQATGLSGEELLIAAVIAGGLLWLLA